MKTDTQIVVSRDCFVIRRVAGGEILIGDDMSMNGIDAPARLRTPDEARKLIAVLEAQIADWPVWPPDPS